jgi:transposase
MEVIVACCAGLDVHQASVVACVNSTGRGGRSHKEVRTFGTMRDDLVALRDWLKDAGVTLVAMESTGVYWKPVYETLEDHFETIVVNARHIKNVPGRKTDVKDCEWISDLLRHGLIRPGFVPPREIRELRELNRYRRKVAQVQACPCEGGGRGTQPADQGAGNGRHQTGRCRFRRVWRVGPGHACPCTGGGSGR